MVSEDFREEAGKMPEPKMQGSSGCGEERSSESGVGKEFGWEDLDGTETGRFTGDERSEVEGFA
jgi:hypothetical protein